MYQIPAVVITVGVVIMVMNSVEWMLSKRHGVYCLLGASWSFKCRNWGVLSQNAHPMLLYGALNES